MKTNMIEISTFGEVIKSAISVSVDGCIPFSPLLIESVSDDDSDIVMYKYEQCSMNDMPSVVLYSTVPVGMDVGDFVKTGNQRIICSMN